MSVNFSIKNVPEELAAGLRARAARNHRSLQGELLAILEAAAAPSRRLLIRDLLDQVRDLKLDTGDEATHTLRAERDAR